MQASTPPKNILVLYSHDHSAQLIGLKKIVTRLITQKQHEFKFVFAASKGVDEAAFSTLKQRFDYVILSCERVAKYTLGDDASLNSAAGSLYGNVLLIPDLQQIYTMPEGSFLFERYLSKVLAPETWIDFPAFGWQRLESQESFSAFKHLASTACLMACDIETTREHRAISCMSFSILAQDNRIYTGVIDARDENYLQRIRELLTLPCMKAFQNGLYDCIYLLRWNCPPHNYAWDTSYAMHSWYSELPKDLGYLAAFFIRDFRYWKTDGRKATNKLDYHTYNAKDAYSTLCCWIAQLKEMPQWAKDNFVINFPRVFPCLLMDLQGLRVNEDIRKEALAGAQSRYDEAENILRRMTGIEDFNARSHVQVNKVLEAFRIAPGTDEKALLKASAKHPLLALVIEQILSVREHGKAISQYFDPELWLGRLYFHLDPAGTETGRLASKQSGFWCGAQIQNFPPYAKVYLEAEPGYVFVEIDNEQSETRCTAYLAQDLNLIKTVESGKDFHSMNAVVFFGVEYDVAKRKQDDGSDSPMRALAKRINHAGSYNMGDNMFVEQAGAKVMELARRLLKLSPHWTLRQIAAHLIGIFDKNYPRVRNEFQSEVKRAIAFTKRLVSPSFLSIRNRALSWTRYFFSDPNLSKPALNAAVAHGPQSLSVQIVNEGMLQVYKDFVFRPGRPMILSAQIHDSLLMQLREDLAEELIPQLQACMAKSVVVHGRVLRIPTAAKITGRFWGKRKK